MLASTLNHLLKVFAGIHDVLPECVASCIRISCSTNFEKLPVGFARLVQVASNYQMEPRVPVALHV